MKLQYLPSTFGRDGKASPCQHLSTLVVDGRVAIDAGGLAMAATADHRENIRNVVISHAHLDHIAGLPLFIDDLFATLKEPVNVHASADVISVLEEHIFNWHVYPKFSELENEFGPVMKYVEFEPGERFDVLDYSVLPIEVNHRVQSCGFIIQSERVTIAATGDTAPTGMFWQQVNELPSVNAVIVECAFPEDLAELAATSHHLTPGRLDAELQKLRHDCPVLIANLKPAYRDRTIEQILHLGLKNVEMLEIGREYIW